jgi:hypothetical protein
VVVHIYNPSTWEAEEVGVWVQGQPEVHNETLFQRTITKKQKRVGDVAQ